MRHSPILWQVAAAAARPRAKAPIPQQSLPLPTTFPTKTNIRLLPSKIALLPSPLNCPTTHPPVLTVAKQEDYTGWWSTGKYMIAKVNAYITFYKAGMKQTFDNMKLRKELKNELLKSLPNINIPGSSMITMSRSEFQIMVRTKRDMKKLPLFGATFLIAPEIVPVVVYFFGTAFLPATCVTPMYLDNRRRRRMDDLDRKNLPVTPRVTPTIEQVKELPRRTLIHECRILGVFARRTPLYLFPTAYLRERLIRRVNYLEYDDELIRNTAKPDLKDMSLDEVKLALEERGVSLYNVVPKDLDKSGIAQKSPQDMYQLLMYWLKLNENKHPNRTFAHEPYIKEMIRLGRLPDL